MAELHWTEVDGVTTVWGNGGTPLIGALLFRTGRADETLVTAGQTHLIEHLVLSDIEDPAHRNNGFVANLPDGCCVEVPIYVDRMGLHPTRVGALPSPLAALNMTNVLVQGLSVEAALSGDTELLVQACALDPLTSAVLTLDEIRRMASEMLEAERPCLPQFAGKALRAVATISIPTGTVRQAVPTDPALAIANRFGKLAEA